MKRALCILALAACGRDETLSGYSDFDSFHLTQIGNAPFAAVATLNIGTPGQISGDGPCNSYRAPQSAPYPWFSIAPLIATRRACADITAETAFFRTLEKMELAEFAGAVLILSDTKGNSLTFQAP